MPRYLVGVDLGTTNTALAYVDLAAKRGPGGGPVLHTFPVPQLVAAGQVAPQDLLPSFLYLPGPHDLPPGATDLPWRKSGTDVVGQFARTQGAKVPGRQVASAKSWLSHPGVDRTAPLLPWAAPPDVPRLSPLEVSARYLKHLVEAWNAAPGRKPEDRLEEVPVVVTVPASFDDVARNLTAEAAKLAGLKHVTLLEEPQAAFYAWLGTHTPDEAGKLKPGMRCLVADVGGGTTDFSLIRAVEEGGELEFVRDAVGDHLLLGGDNMDLALAKAVEGRLPGGKLDAAQFGSLVQACRSAKEALLANPPPPSYPVTVVGRGRSVVGGAVSVNLTPADLRATLFDGFLPLVPFDATPTRGARGGLQEMGLPYVSDPAVTKHLAAFLRQHTTPTTTLFSRDAESSERSAGTTNDAAGSPALPSADSGSRLTRDAVDAVLFNGGVFQPAALRERFVDVMRPWFGPAWAPLVLTSPSLDLAVAWGAAYFGWLKQSGGRRIGGGVPRSYYVGVDAGAGEGESVLCVVPRRLQEGEEISLPKPELELALGEPVLFPLFTSTVRADDKPGDVLRLPPGSLLHLPPLHTVLRGGKRAGMKRVPVTLAARCTEIGTLELACVSREGNRWRLEFNVRDVMHDPRDRDDDPDPVAAGVVDVFPEEKVQAAGELIAAAFNGSGAVTPQELPKRLEAVLEVSRGEWPSALCRRLWDFLDEAADGRRRSPAHLSRWYNLVGFVLRPGFGDPLDRYRVEGLWKRLTAAASGQAGGKVPAVPDGGADYWVMWRRVAGGLNTPLQQALFSRLKPVLLPPKGKPFARPPANEYAEMWRAAAALERLDAKTKETLAAALLPLVDRPPVYLFWSLTRLGARVQLYGPLNTLAHPDVVEGWLDRLLTFTPPADADRLPWLFCLAQLARRSGLRAVDVSETVRERVLATLRSHAVPDGWPRMVSEVVQSAGDDRSQMFGESLPIGLRLSE